MVSLMRDSDEGVRNELICGGVVDWIKLKVLKPCPVFVCLQPEWYLTQALIWMGSSTAFMEEKIQPVFDRAGATISARVGRSPTGHKITQMFVILSGRDQSGGFSVL